MSSFYDDASLVVIPSGYKTSKVYAEKPTDGSGDLAFTRTGDTATRVNSAGLIEKVRTNLALYSEDLTNAAWTKNRSTITANALVNPVNGATTADYIVETATTGTHEAVQTFIISSGISYTISVYAKADTRTKIALVLAGSGFTSGGNGQAIFNLSTGAVVSAINGATARISDAGNGWYRCSITKASVDTNGVIALQLVDASDNTSYTGDGTSRAAFFGAQFEVSDFGATPYIPTTTAAVSTGPTANVPRLDYTGSTCPRLLLEPQRTNLVTYSEQFNNAAWTKFNATVTANTSVSPDGYTNADTIVISSSGYILQSFPSYSAVSGQKIATSIFAKNQTNGFLAFGGATPAGTDVYTIDNYGNGWYRHSVVRTFTVTTTGTVQYIIATVGTHIIWGAQVEGSNSSYPTSYIPTLAATATRGADACSKTGISSLIGQTEGTLFYDGFYGNEINEVYVFLQKESSSGVDDSIYIQQSSGAIALNVYSGATQQTFIIGSSPTLGQRIKIAAGYKANDFVLYVNGVQIGTDNSGAVPTCGALQLGSYRATPTAANFIATKGTNQALLFKTRLTNAQLAELTTL